MGRLPCTIFRDGNEVILGSRNEKPLTLYFPEMVAPILAMLPDRIVIDGELTRVTANKAVAARWFKDFEGAGLDGLIAKPTGNPLCLNHSRSHKMRGVSPSTATVQCPWQRR